MTRRLLAAEAVRLYLCDEARARRYGLPRGIAGPELRFAAPHRNWAFDFAYPGLLLAIEVEGGTYGAVSRHTSGTGYADDCLKYSAAALLGWCVLRVTTDLVEGGAAFDLIDAALEQRRALYQFSTATIAPLPPSGPMVTLLRTLPKQRGYRARLRARIDRATVDPAASPAKPAAPRTRTTARRA